MSSAQVAIVDPRGNPLAEIGGKVTDVSALPSVWDQDSSIDWLVEGMIPRGSVTLISAESGTGKTWLAYALAAAVARGVDFLGRTVHRAPVVYLDGENPLYVVQRNLRDLGIDPIPDLRVWGGWNEESPPGPNDTRILSFVREQKPLLIWDSLVEFNTGDEQSSTEMRRFMKFFRALAHLGATIIILHHTGKSKSSGTYRGSSDIKASVDVAYLVTGSTRSGKLHRLTMDPFKSRIAPGQKFAMEFRERKGFFGIDVPKQAAKPDPFDTVRRIVMDNPKSNATRIKELAKPLGVSKGKVDEVLGSGEFSFEPGKGSEKLYWVEEAVVEEAVVVEEHELPDFPDPGVEEIRKSPEPS